ncbi:AAA family ATPase [Leifsonia sp. H3M29-4]|uniref:AAA family ATPase n=1 Tax=Salinibacterium metalliresistens TaxID=3031321 RepID=UPI0023D9B074|nr:AAA family ATPase [Salinibacterium metalliresistens]MDF1478906.1 AAA family ATPase [Salinibacterium metalliresistens]
MQLSGKYSYKSFESFSETPLPNFVVITGPNGAGKSHLLEAIKEGRIVDLTWPTDPTSRRLLTSVDLASSIAELNSGESRDSRIDEFQRLIHSFTRFDHDTAPSPQLTPSYRQNVVKTGTMSLEGIIRAEAMAGKPLYEWERDEFVKFAPNEFGSRDPFAVSVGSSFGLYQQTRTLNRFNRWQHEEFGTELPWQSEDDFLAIHGRPPWELLNGVLESLNLGFRFDEPASSIAPGSARAVMRNADGVELPLTELSSGEKTLMFIALAMYSGRRRPEVLVMPSVLLLDEPDAALHPSMIRNLLDLLVEEFVGRHGVSVIMTTHSPTTVALAPEESIYLMSSGQPRLSKATSRDAALSRLLIGVPNVSVRAEHRRAIIVESANDERLYFAIERALSSRIVSERSLSFLQAGGDSRADGKAAVLELVAKLRGQGVPVWGLVDRDDEMSEPHQYVFFDPSRYTLENVVLDPLGLGLMLLQEATPGLAEAIGTTYLEFEIDKHGQATVDFLTAVVVPPGAARGESVVKYLDAELRVDKYWLEVNGKAVLDSVLATYPALKEHRSRLMDRIVERVWQPRPGVIPRATADLLGRFRAD